MRIGVTRCFMGTVSLMIVDIFGSAVFGEIAGSRCSVSKLDFQHTAFKRSNSHCVRAFMATHYSKSAQTEKASPITRITARTAHVIFLMLGGLPIFQLRRQ